MLHNPSSLQRIRLQAAAIEAFGVPVRPETHRQMAFAQQVLLLGWEDQAASGRAYALSARLDAYLIAHNISPGRISAAQLAHDVGETVEVAKAAIGLLGRDGHPENVQTVTLGDV